MAHSRGVVPLFETGAPRGSACGPHAPRYHAVAVLGLLSVFLTTPASASQVLVLDMKAVGNAPATLADALTPLLVSELGRVQGLSVVSQFELTSLLEQEANKQALGCDDTGCMAEIANALGAQLLVATTLARIGDKWNVHMSLVETESAAAVKRATGTSSGTPEAASAAVLNAVSALFRDGMPRGLMGPASMSRRGFGALLSGFGKALMDKAQEPRSLRKRIILDLINTELDFDAEPKLEMLRLAIARGAGGLRVEAMGATDEAHRDMFIAAIDTWSAMYGDLQRVKEIRVRSRERGIVPSARPLRFAPPEPTLRADLDDIADYHKVAEPARILVTKALAALHAGDYQSFRATWGTERSSAAQRYYDDSKRELKRKDERCELLPRQAIMPKQYKRLISGLKEGKDVTILLRCYRGEALYSEDRVWIPLAELRIRSW